MLVWKEIIDQSAGSDKLDTTICNSVSKRFAVICMEVIVYRILSEL